MTHQSIFFVAAFVVSLTSGACSSAPEAKADTNAATEAKKPAQTAKKEVAKPAATSSSTATMPVPKDAPVMFAFDSADLTVDGQSYLNNVATYLTATDTVDLTIEGHADDRGTDEYNLSLGQRRADIIRQYLERKGVEQQRIKSVSYGEHRPAVSGDSEDAWSKNRRGEIKVKLDNAAPARPSSDDRG